MATTEKDTIYIDIDDEITGIIDKVRGSDGKITALVLPKRAATFQSVVNMKLLKRAADDAKKHLVLITAEPGLLPLAGAAGIHVAKSINSKPEIPLAPSLNDDSEEMVDERAADDLPITTSPAAAGVPPLPADGVETVALDDEDEPSEATPVTPATRDFTPPSDKKASKPKKNKGLAVPNFERFRKLLIIGGIVLLLLVALAIVAIIVLPKATINVKTDATNVPTSLNLNLSTTADSLDTDSGTIPAKVESQQKTYTETVPTTGQKNEGNKAAGTITVSGGSCGATAPADIPSGSAFVANNLTYITQDSITFNQATFRGRSCTFTGQGSNGESNIPITAQAGGASYNTGNGSTFSDPQDNSVSASGLASGGSDNIVQTVNQNDINNAKSKISTSDANGVKQSLENQLQQDGDYAITATFSNGTPTVTNSANVGDTANTVTVTEVATYMMFGVHESDLKTLVDNSVQGQINTSKQSILSEGLDSASYSVVNSSASSAQLTMQTTAVAGPEINVNSLKQQAAGKKPADVQSQIGSDPDITGVSVKLSPFWVGSVPKKASKITVDIAKPTTTTSNGNASSNNP